MLGFVMYFVAYLALVLGLAYEDKIMDKKKGQESTLEYLRHFDEKKENDMIAFVIILIICCVFPYIAVGVLFHSIFQFKNKKQ